MTRAPRPAVADFATDFDHTDPAWVGDPFPIWDDLRARCPVAHSDRYGGVWLPTRHEDVSAIAYDTDHFSSRGVVVAEVKPQAEPPIGGAPPITSDPPFHAFARRLLLPAFAPRPIQALEPVTRQLCRDLLDRIGDAAECDAAVDYAQDIPPAVIARMLGLPPEDDELFRGFIHDVLESITDDEEAVMGKEEGLDSYLDRHIADHVEHPRDDLISYLLDVEIEGTRLSPEHVRGTVLLLLIAGHRHDVERDRRRAVAPGLARRRPPPPRRRTGAHGARPSRSCCGPTPRSRWPGSWPRTPSSAGAGWPRATGSCCPSRPPTATPRSSRTPTASCSTGPSTATPRSASASTAASGPTWRAWS